jgi:hypothetical protein
MTSYTITGEITLGEIGAIIDGDSLPEEDLAVLVTIGSLTEIKSSPSKKSE